MALKNCVLVLYSILITSKRHSFCSEHEDTTMILQLASCHAFRLQLKRDPVSNCSPAGQEKDNAVPDKDSARGSERTMAKRARKKSSSRCWR